MRGGFILDSETIQEREEVVVLKRFSPKRAQVTISGVGGEYALLQGRMGIEEGISKLRTVDTEIIANSSGEPET